MEPAMKCAPKLVAFLLRKRKDAAPAYIKARTYGTIPDADGMSFDSTSSQKEGQAILSSTIIGKMIAQSTRRDAKRLSSMTPNG